jgi:hypothetical protein
MGESLRKPLSWTLTTRYLHCRLDHSIFPSNTKQLQFHLNFHLNSEFLCNDPFGNWRGVDSQCLP